MKIVSSFVPAILLSAVSLSATPAYEIHVTPLPKSWSAEIRFSDPKLPPVSLSEGKEELPYRPVFSKSPDGRWILQIQKTGSGDNVAYLHTVDDAGRVLILQPRWDSLAWKFAENASGIPHSELYHTGVSCSQISGGNGADPQWTDHQTLIFTLHGSNSDKSDPAKSGISLRLEYDLAKNTFSKKESR